MIRVSELVRPLVDTDLVVWHTFGLHHLPRPEDFPVQPVVTAGFALRASAFFDENPALDVPPASSGTSCCVASSRSAVLKTSPASFCYWNRPFLKIALSFLSGAVTRHDLDR